MDDLIKLAVEAFQLTDPEPISQGGQKSVAKAQWDGAPVVLKLIDLRRPDADTTLERARREVGLLARIDHPNVVRLVDPLGSNPVLLGTPRPTGLAWLEEFLPGKDLAACLQARRCWPWVEAAAMGLDVARGLAELHYLQAVHRDISPANVRCLPDGTCKLMDPGYAHHIGRTTLTGIIQPGTPGYLTPEHVVAGVRPTPASDVFQVGLLLYEALAGEPPFSRDVGVEQYMANLRVKRAPSIRLARPDLTKSQGAIVDRCLHPQPARRYLNGKELGEALEAVQ
jgi:serine/threonine-protein kinase